MLGVRMPRRSGNPVLSEIFVLKAQTGNVNRGPCPALPTKCATAAAQQDCGRAGHANRPSISCLLYLLNADHHQDRTVQSSEQPQARDKFKQVSTCCSKALGTWRQTHSSLRPT